ncbi:MAG: DUF1499 domain-containing protein [Notoacmeibacter sp.]|nr:DUF1499 domain-containing protein [Notoacmeibacter sp.]
MFDVVGWIAAGAVALVMLVMAGGFAFGWENVWERIAGPADRGAYDFAKGKRRRTPNDALACTPGACSGSPDLALPEYQQTPAELTGAIVAHIAATDPTAERVDDGTNPAYARFVARSRLMRFPDTVDIEAVVLDDGRTGLRAYGRAQLGRSDHGVNRARLEAWLAAQR